ncbi:formylglycine-generating enzyme family protein [Rhodoferax aquaticus]|uniref:Formylglycine-generating enzyme family protein n=1 Tax=Rhodoferax aquaticus TaxID=2527691 RepID=A0A515ETX9_9BURK|nr:formylglycine-generating enzyme family protein [Rhodoferax aquaticus]QDL56135.1 formylglycine-generating enzyme family protein [Rhodoferax aquaticus]
MASVALAAPTKATAHAFTNRLGMRMVRIPAGEFLMGNDEPVEALAKAYPLMEAERLTDLSDEAPVHRVRITRGFYMGQTEVTVGQFRRFLKASGYVPESIADGTGGYGYNPQYDPSTTKRGDLFEGRDPKYSWKNPGFAQTDKHPVVNVTWNDAQALARWLSEKEGKTYRVPTEAEWEYAARAGTRTRYYNGDNPELQYKVGNTFDASAKAHWPKMATKALKHKDGFAFTAPVAQFKPNKFGLYDMHGNAWEWTNDLYGEDYYANSPVDDPQGPTEGNVYVRRGGSWHTWPLYTRSSYRNWNSPQTRYTLVGMRLVMDVKAR